VQIGPRQAIAALTRSRLQASAGEKEPPPMPRIALFSALGGHSKPWVWTIDLALSDGRDPTHGFEATREAAMQAFARSWHRET
jgi:hypothetical protein